MPRREPSIVVVHVFAWKKIAIEHGKQFIIIEFVHKYIFLKFNKVKELKYVCLFE